MSLINGLVKTNNYGEQEANPEQSKDTANPII